MIKQAISSFLFILFLCPLPAIADEHVQYDPYWAARYAEENYDKPYGSQNPFPDFDNVVEGGNCTNFVSQALIAGFLGTDSPQEVYDDRDQFDIDKDCYLNGQCTLAWFYNSMSSRGPAWSGANKLYEYAKSNGFENEGLHFEYVTHDTMTDFMDYTEVEVGDIIFADWDHDGSIDHSMIVTDTQFWKWGYNEIRVTYQSFNKTNIGLGDINKDYGYQALFYVYRPVDYDPKIIDYEEKVRVVFDWLEDRYGQYFSNGSSTIQTSSGYYRYYWTGSRYNYLYAYKEYLWFMLDGSWIKSSSIETWYEYVK